MRMVPAATVLPVLFISPVRAAEWQAHPSISFSEFYTDNVSLAPAGAATSSWVTQVRPQITLTYNGNNFKFSASYAAEFLYHSDSQDLTINNIFSGGTLGSMELVPQILFLDTNSNVSQYNNSLSGPLATNNINTTGNRNTVRTTTISPYIRDNFGLEAELLARFSYSFVSSDAPGSIDSTTPAVDVRLTSGPAWRLTTWGLQYTRRTEKTEDFIPDNTFENVTFNVKRLITYNLALVGSVGYDNNSYQAIRGVDTKGASWSAGINWTPTPRTNLTATYGRKYYGPSGYLQFNHRTGYTVWNASYSETVTTTNAQFLVPTQGNTATILDALFLPTIPDPVLRQQAVRDFIAQQGLPSTLIVPVNFVTNQVFLAKTWQGSVGIQYPRHSVFANLYSTTSETQTPGLPGGAGDFNANNTVKQAGTSLIWNWRVSPFDSANASIGYSRNEFPTSGRDDHLKYLRLSLSHQFSPRMTGSLSYQRLNSDSNQAGSSYTENQVQAQVGVSF